MSDIIKIFAQIGAHYLEDETIKVYLFDIQDNSIELFEEQKEIVKKIENLFKIHNELETQINSSKINSQTLMQSVLKEALEK